MLSPLQTSFDEAVELTREALAQQRFGILTEIDMKATPKAKLGEDIARITTTERIFWLGNPNIGPPPYRAPGANAELMYDAAVVDLC